MNQRLGDQRKAARPLLVDRLVARLGAVSGDARCGWKVGGSNLSQYLLVNSSGASWSPSQYHMSV